jgi:hypothetical protein
MPISIYDIPKRTKLNPIGKKCQKETKKVIGKKKKTERTVVKRG